MTDEERQAEHAKLYKRASDMLAIQAGMLTRLAGPVKLSWVDVGDLFAGTAVNIYLHEIGPRAAVKFLRELAAKVEADAPLVS